MINNCTPIGVEYFLRGDNYGHTQSILENQMIICRLRRESFSWSLSKVNQVACSKLFPYPFRRPPPLWCPPWCLALPPPPPGRSAPPLGPWPRQTRRGAGAGAGGGIAPSPRPARPHFREVVALLYCDAASRGYEFGLRRPPSMPGSALARLLLPAGDSLSHGWRNQPPVDSLCTGCFPWGSTPRSFPLLARVEITARSRGPFLLCRQYYSLTLGHRC